MVDDETRALRSPRISSFRSARSFPGRERESERDTGRDGEGEHASKGAIDFASRHVRYHKVPRARLDSARRDARIPTRGAFLG